MSRICLFQKAAISFQLINIIWLPDSSKVDFCLMPCKNPSPKKYHLGPKIVTLLDGLKSLESLESLVMFYSQISRKSLTFWINFLQIHHKIILKKPPGSGLGPLHCLRRKWSPCNPSWFSPNPGAPFARKPRTKGWCFEGSGFVTRKKMDETSLNTFSFRYVDLELNAFCSDHHAYTKLLCMCIFLYMIGYRIYMVAKNLRLQRIRFPTNPVEWEAV